MSRLEAAVNRLYARSRGGLLVAVFVIWVLAALVVIVVAAGILIRVEDLSADDLWQIVRVVGPVAMAAVVAFVVATARKEQIPRVWLRDGPQEAAAEAAWLAVSSAPRRNVVRALFVIGLPFSVSTVVAGGSVIGFGPAELAFLVWGLGFGLTYLVALGYVAATIAALPVLAEIGRYLPRDFAPPTPDSRRLETIAELVAVQAVTAVAAVGYAVDRGIGSQRAIELGLMVAVGAVAFALPLALVFTERSMAPVRALTLGTRRVTAGDLATAVPMIARDEFGELIASFNAMMEELARAAEEVQVAQARIVAASDAERRRVERDLHDGAQQHLVLLRLKLAMAERALARDPASAGPLLDEAKADLESALEQLRDLARGIYPAILESDGIVAALRDAATRSPLSVSVHDGSTGRYTAAIEAATYFCCLEALQNAAKHAGDEATVNVTVGERDGLLTFEVADDGPGFAGTPSGSGLTNMADRVGALGGKIAIDSRPGQGTRVRGAMPVT